MGQLTFPLYAKVYLDTSPIIYSVEKHADYWQLLTSLWQSLKANELEVYTSELTLLEIPVQSSRRFVASADVAVSRRTNAART